MMREIAKNIGALPNKKKERKREEKAGTGGMVCGRVLLERGYCFVYRAVTFCGPPFQEDSTTITFDNSHIRSPTTPTGSREETTSTEIPIVQTTCTSVIPD
jgi:hypothetical protein